MKKRVLIYDNGDVAFIQGNIFVKSSGSKKLVEEIELDDAISNKEFEEIAIRKEPKSKINAFIARAKKMGKISRLKGGEKTAIISTEKQRALNSERATNFEE